MSGVFAKLLRGGREFKTVNHLTSLTTKGTKFTKVAAIVWPGQAGTLLDELFSMNNEILGEMNIAHDEDGRLIPDPSAEEVA